MTTDVYEKLAAHLDNLPSGFPRTEGGVEMRILRRLFTPEDAELATHLTIIPEESRVVARRAGIPVEEAARRLDEMERKGLITRRSREGKSALYMARQFLPGFWEGQIDRLDPDLVRDVHEYEPTFHNLDNWRKAPILRTIPVKRSIDVTNEIMAYEAAEQVVRDHTSFAVSNCICRQGMRLLGKPCKKPEESCLSFGIVADYLSASGRARKLDLEETLAILQRADEAGLVLQPANAKDPFFMCTCCGCCCGVLGAIKKHPKPASVVSTPFFASLDAQTCKGCGLCAKRCQMDAFSLVDKKAQLNVDRCIGCGLCVSTCPTHSLSLVRKPESKQPEVPKDMVKSNIKRAQARGKLGARELIALQLRSKLDRLLSR